MSDSQPHCLVEQEGHTLGADRTPPEETAEVHFAVFQPGTPDSLGR